MKTKVNKSAHTVVSTQSSGGSSEATNSNSAIPMPTPNDDQVSPKQTRPKSKPKAKSAQKRKRRQSSSSSCSSSSSSCDDSIDPAIEKKLKQSASRNNLTHENVKNILHKVVRNDHVLAIVKLKEEELEKYEQAKKLIKLHQNDDDEDAPATLPKLTRAKARALNKFPLPLAPLKSTQLDSDVVALISEELRSDDDDEEYQPGDDDVETDDDFNTTTSDIDSQPRTPQTPSSHIEHDEETTPRTMYTTDGLFKVPRARNESTTSQFEQEYIIAQRTRSKVNLAETPIEAIESNFKAPDVPIDFYGNTDLDPDDLPWSEFMFNYRFDKAPDHEEDEDGDPDYIAADKAPVDKEELRQPKVPKKELEDLLVAHEIDASDNNWWNDFLAIEFGEQSNDAPNSSLTTPVKSDSDGKLLLPRATSPIFANVAPTAQTAHAIQLNTETAPSMAPSYFDSTKVQPPNQSYAMPLETNGHFDQRYFNNHHNQSNSSQLDVAKHLNVATVSNISETYLHLGSTSGSVPSVGSNPTNGSWMPLPSTNASQQFVLIVPATAATALTPTAASAQNNLPLNILNRQIETGGLRQRTVPPKRTRFKKERFTELENLDPQNIAARKTFNSAARDFTSEQQLILEQQLRMHVQLATQSFMQTYGHTEHYAHACKFKRFLTDLREINQCKRVCNLNSALALVAEWENELSAVSAENTELIRHIQTEIDKLRANSRYEMRFHERWLKKVCHSPVFIYPTLLPRIPFRFDTKKVSEYLPSEDYLIAFELERYYIELKEKMQRYKLLKPKEVSLATVCKYISAHFCYLRSAKSIYDYVRLRRSDSQIINPIKYYFVHQVAPTFKHRMIPFDANGEIEPAKRTLQELPPQFAKFVEKLIGFEHDKLLNNFVASEPKSTSLTKPFNYRSKSVVKDKVDNSSNRSDDVPDKSIIVEVIYRNANVAHPCHRHDCESSFSQIDQSTDSCLNCSRCTAASWDLTNELNISRHSNQSISKGQTRITSYFKKKPKPTSPSSQPFEDNCANGECDSVDEALTDVHSEESTIALKTSKRCRLQIVRKYLRLHYRKIRCRLQLRRKLDKIREKTKRLCTKRWHPYRRRPLVLFTFLCLDTYHKHTSQLMKMNGLNAPIGRRPVSNFGRSVSITSNKSQPVDVMAANRRVQKIVAELNGGVAISDEVNAKRLTKGNRTAENARMMLMYENQQESSEKDCIFAQHYFDRVEETFVNESNHQKLNEFLTILRCFDNSKENGAHLYLKLEQLFAPDHLELADLFLNFLQPSDATEIGKFMEHFLYTNMSKFINRLHLFYQKQPAQLRKVLACLRELAEEEDLKLEKIRKQIVPLLKGNQLLVDWFQQCLGGEIGGENSTSIKDEYETISFRKAAETIDDDTDAYEHIPQSEIFPDPNDNPCHIRYMNGRLFYGNRLSFPAKLSFSATNTNVVASERSSGVAPVPKTTTTTCTRAKHKAEKDSVSTVCASYRCVHNINDFGNMKLQVKSRNPMETDQMDNSTTEEGEDSEDDQQPFDVKMIAVEERSSGEANSTHVLCDDKMLKAHGIRLNPSAHSSVIYNNAEMLNMLRPASDCLADGHRECKLSPKKLAPKTSATSAQTKLPRKHSPNAKKTNGANQVSPNRKNMSPLSALIHGHPSASKLTSDSPAIQTAKKLKRILESSSSLDEKTENTTTTATTAAVTATTVPTTAKRNNPPTPSLTNKIRRINRTAADASVAVKVKTSKIPCDNIDEQQTSDAKAPTPLIETGRSNESELTKKETEQPTEVLITWSRDEDRLLLEHIKDGLESNHELITQITHEFPTKTAKNIEERIDFLIDFLTKLRNIT